MRNLISRFGLALLGLGMSVLAARAQFTLSTAVSYSGRQTGEVWVAASPFQTPLITTFKTLLSSPVGAPFANAPVTITNLVGTYHLFAWRDSVANGVPDATEAQGWHPDNPFAVTNNRTVTGFVIEDPDNDADHLPDFWEAVYGLPTRPGSGSSGALTLDAGETVFTDAIWASVVGLNSANMNTLNISTNRGFATNDLVLIITMQDTNTNWAVNKAGTFEFARIASASSNVLTLRSNRLNAFNVGTSNRIQVVKVPEYTEVTMPPAFALQFDGSGDYVEAGAVPLANTSFTIEAWARRDSSDTMDFIVGQGGQSAHQGLMFGFHWDWVGFVFDFYGDGPATFEVDNAWHHWAGTYDASTRLQCLYRDGVLLATNVADQNYQGSGSLFIGTIWGADFHGSLDEVRIWSKVRSQAEIQADMNRWLRGTEPGLLAYYRFDEGAGTNVLDATGHGYYGVTRGSPVWGLPRLNSPTTLTCEPWNGTNGGVLAFVAHQVTLGSNAVISADGKGYRGGVAVPAGSQYGIGQAGERTAGGSTSAREGDCLARDNGGGGAGKGADGSGGGGSYGTSGANGDKVLALSDYGRGAAVYGTNNLSRLNVGGGGGGSGSHDNSRIGTAGGAGGGLVFVAAGSITGSGTISSCGAPGQNGVYLNSNNSGAGGGGGAGGSIYLVSDIGNSVSTLATGGAGGTAARVDSRPGGAGGVGRIRLDLPPEASVPANVLPAAGYTNQSLAGLSLIPGGEAYDSDYDGLSDRQEYDLNTSPLSPDTDGDTLPDKWEAECGLNPRSAGDAAASQDLDADGVENMLEFYRGTLPDDTDSDDDGLSDSAELFVYHTDPLQQDTDADGINDAQELAAGRDPLSRGTQYYYDAIDRLAGAHYENGLALGYEYDGNNNLLRQVYLLHDATTNNLPDVWEFLHNLTNNTSGFADTDGDGWSDYQEWQADTNPRDASSTPNILGSAGTNLVSLTLPFTPSNFVVAVGQLDGIGAEEIVIGADGNPGTLTNSLLVLWQTNASWFAQRVNVGSFGVTSIAVGQPGNRPAAIYVGLRETGGTGKVMEFTRTAGVWTSNVVVISSNEAAFVLGVRGGRYVLASLAGTNGLPGCPHYLTYSSGWTALVANINTSQRGLGTMTAPELPGVLSRGVRLLDSGGLQVVGHDVNVPPDAIWNEDYLRWFFRTTGTYSWANAQSYSSNSYGGNLATVTDATLDAWLWSHFGGSGINIWIGLFRESTSAPWQWASGKPFTYANWAPGEPTTDGLGAHMWEAYGGRWNDAPGPFRAVVEVTGIEDRSILAAEPLALRPTLWRGHSLNAGKLRLTNAVSIFYAFVDDENMNGTMDAGDDFVLAEYLFSGSDVTINDLQRIPLSGSLLARSYGLACVDVLYANQQVLFTAEPDGRVFAWSATNTTAALQRQLFSAHDTGKAWHALAAVRTLEAGQSLAGLRVDPTEPNQCDLILWPPQQQLPALADIPQTAPVTQILPSPNSGRDIARVNLRVWDAEGGGAWLELEFQRTNSVAWSNATIAVSGAPQGFVSTSAIGLTHQVYWDAAQDLGPGFTNTVQLRARAHDFTLTGDWSPSVLYTVQNSLTNQVRATNDFATTVQGVPVNIDVLANDNSASRFIANLGVPAHGSAATNLNKTVRYTPDSDFVGTDQFAYTLTDGAGGFDVATVTVLVTQGAQVEILLESPSVQGGNQFKMTISGAAGQVYHVQVSTNLANWSNVQTLTNLTGTVLFTEQVPPNTRARFYRAVLVP
jgi:hypothetical protein